MRKTILLGIIGLLCSHQSLFAQNINGSMDSIQTLLCKKWEVNYALMGGMKIGRVPGATEMNYEFNKDKTFLLTSNGSKDKTKGTWSYDAKKKLIKLTLNGKSNTTITSLKEDELVILTDMKGASPDDPMELQMVLKVKAK